MFSRKWALSAAMTYSAMLIAVICGGTTVWAAEDQAKDDVVKVQAEGEGLDQDQAIRAALRAALEKGGKQEIFSDTKVENYQLIHDTIISRAQGLVKNYKIVKGPDRVIGGTVKVWIEADVSKSVLAQSWGEVQNLLNQIGRPKILVWINERIDGRLEEGSALESQIEERLLKSGFDLVARKAVEAIRQKEMDDAAAEDNMPKLQAIAKDFEAHFFIAGTANANQAGVEEKYNVPISFYNCDVQVKGFYTDTGKLIASKSIPNTRGGARGYKEFSPQAGKMAIVNVSQPLVDALYEQMMEQWATAISAGGELILEVEGFNFAAANRLKRALDEIKKVEHVNMNFSKGLATYRINAKLGADELAELLCEDDFEKMLEIVDLKLNRIQAKGK
ncbi:MAG: hypothetical protein GXY44_14880 [Phycisphaerales bacterium]|nr:hypothetical protein [Phycisphaerales bacterium]